MPLRTILLLILTLSLSACIAQNAEPLVIVATPNAPDAGFQTYQHDSGVFSLRVPSDWIPDQLPDDNGLRMQFTAVEGAERVVRLSIMVVNTGTPMTAEAFINAVNAYQPPPDLSSIPWRPLSDPAAMSDGSVRLVGLREYPNLGTRGLNIFLQGNGSYFSALEVDVTDTSPEMLETLLAVVNTYRIDSRVPLMQGRVAPPGVMVASGELIFNSYSHWQDSNGGFNITGQISNAADQPLEAIRLTAYLYDEANRQLAQRADVLGYDVLNSQESAAFRIRFDTGRPSTAVRYEIHAAAREANLNLERRYDNSRFIFGEENVFYNPNGFLTISGLVQNNGQRIVGSVKVLAAIYNEAGEVVAAESTFIRQDELVPGEAAPFEITIFDSGGSAYRYTLMAQGMVR